MANPSALTVALPSRINPGHVSQPPGGRLMRNTTWSCIGSAAPMLQTRKIEDAALP
jgi:hypothetical protein